MSNELADFSSVETKAAVGAGSRGRRGWWARGWPVAVMALVAGFAVWHAVAMAGYLDRVSAERFVAEPGELVRERIPLGLAFDAQTWIRLSEELAEGGGWRLRQAINENAPEGRPVYWNSGWAWWLIGGGRLWSTFADVSFTEGLERAAVWANLPVLLLMVGGLGLWTLRRRGAGAAAVLAAVLVGHRGFYAGFYPGNADHHGVITGCAAGMILGIVLSGAGWHRAARSGREDKGKSWWPADAAAVRRGMTVSAVLGAVGLWFSAASLIPVFVALGVGLLLAGRPAAEGLVFSGAAWRWWGRLGGVLSLGFYLLEQFPDRLGWRLEVNHPVYALAWAGGAELLAWWLERGDRARGRGMEEARRARVRLASGLGAVALPAVVVVLGGGAVFGLFDPFLKQVHAQVTELASLPERIGALGWRHYAGYVVIEPLFLLVAGGLAWRLRAEASGYLPRLSWVVAVLLVALGWWQNRWMLMAGGPLAVLAVTVAGTVCAGDGRVWGRRLWVGVTLVLLTGFHPWQLVAERLAVARHRDVQTFEARQLLYREVARVLRADAAGGAVRLLAAPDASTAVAYFGDFQSLGTLYWENRAGLERAGGLLAAEDEEAAGVMAGRQGVTHVALFGHDGGGELYWKTHDAPDRPAGGLGGRLLAGEIAPRWLRPILYVVPPQFSRIESRVRLFAVDFAQTPAEAAYRHGLAAIAHGERQNALRCFLVATREAPQMPAPWFRLAESHLAESAPRAALTAMLAGIETLPLAERENAALEAARLFSAHGARAEADVLLDRAVAAGR